MKITKKENFLLVENENDSLTEFSSKLTKQHIEIQKENVVVNFTQHPNISADQLLAFLEISNVHRAENRSFILVNDSLGIDELPEELVIVPTLQEAEDMIQMDEIQRDLGF